MSCGCNRQIDDGRNTMSAEERYNICKSCEWFRSSIKQCKKCGCFMLAKTKLKFSRCPLRKWQ